MILAWMVLSTSSERQTWLGSKGIRVLDAPVSGGEAGAIEAVLSIMVGGEQADFDAARPVLEALGKTIVLCGPHGSGASQLRARGAPGAPARLNGPSSCK